MGFEPMTLPNTGRMLYQLSYKDSEGSEVINRFCRWYMNCDTTHKFTLCLFNYLYVIAVIIIVFLSYMFPLFCFRLLPLFLLFF